MKLNENTLKIFVDTIKQYFDKSDIGTVKVLLPFLGNVGELPAHDYSGLIQITGEYQGVIYFTSTKSLIDKVLSHLGYESNEDNILDLVGEMSNIFAGNIRKELGPKFEINPPVSISGTIKKVHFKADDTPYILPIEFGGEKSMLVISFSKRPEQG